MLSRTWQPSRGKPQVHISIFNDPAAHCLQCYLVPGNHQGESHRYIFQYLMILPLIVSSVISSLATIKGKATGIHISIFNDPVAHCLQCYLVPGNHQGESHRYIFQYLMILSPNVSSVISSLATIKGKATGTYSNI